MAITNFMVTDPYTGDVDFTKTPKRFKGHWVHPTALKEYEDTKDRTASRKTMDGYKDFRKTVARFRSS